MRERKCIYTSTGLICRQFRSIQFIYVGDACHYYFNMSWEALNQIHVNMAFAKAWRMPSYECEGGYQEKLTVGGNGTYQLYALFLPPQVKTKYLQI